MSTDLGFKICFNYTGRDNNKMAYFVYILECAGKTLYTGITDDVGRRVGEHNSGKGAKYTRSHLPVKLVWKTRCRNRSSALKKEARIKNLTRKQKLLFIKERLIKKLAGIAILIPVMTANVFSAGFRLAEQSAAANGMGNAFAAVADDASAVWYNPAAITALDGTQFSAGSVMVFPAIRHVNTTGTTDKAERKIHVPPHFFATHKINGRFAAGFGFNAPFGLSSDWDKATANTKYTATLSDIKVFNLNPNAAYKITDNLSVAAGVDFVILKASLNKMYPGKGELQLEGDGTGWGYNAAVYYSASEKLNFGANYRSKVKVDVTGTARETQTLLDNPAVTQLTLPDMFQFGVAYRFTEKMTVAAESDFTAWSTYDKLTVKSDTIRSLLLTTDTSTDLKEWNDVWAIRFGGQYRLNDVWKLRAGYFYDENPVPEGRMETRVPDADRDGYSLGAGCTFGNLTIDASYLYIKFRSRNVGSSMGGYDDAALAAAGASGTVARSNAAKLKGTYKTSAQLPAITVSYKF